MAASGYAGHRLRVTEGLRHFAKMNVVGTRRKPSERYKKSLYRGGLILSILELIVGLMEALEESVNRIRNKENKVVD